MIVSVILMQLRGLFGILLHNEKWVIYIQVHRVIFMHFYKARVGNF